MTRNLPDAPPTEKQPRSKGIYVYWGVALTLLLALGLFCWLVVAPYLEVRAMVARFYVEESDEHAEAEIAKAGGPRAAAEKLCFYLRLPDGLARDKYHATWLLGYCRPDGFEPLVAMLKANDWQRRHGAAYALRHLDDHRAVPPLIAALKDEASLVRWRAVGSLGRLGDRRAIGPLTSALKGENPLVCEAIRNALKKLKAAGKEKGTPK